MNSYSVLMTACVDPSKGRLKVHRNDPSIRLADYMEGLRFWLDIDDARIQSIVFIENSGYPLDALKNIASSCPTARPVEFISLSDNEYPEGAHYGYAELSMVDHAVASSVTLRRATHFIKATGRLTFPDVSRLLDRLPDECLFAVDARNSTLFRRRPQIFVTTQLMVLSRSFYESELLGAKSELGRRESHIETLFYRKLLPFAKRRGAMLRWPVNVAPSGMAAHWEKAYHSPRQKIVNAARAVCRVVLPNWWI